MLTGDLVTTPAPARSFDLPDLVIPYLTTDEYAATPTALDINNLVPNADTATQTAELATLIRQASGWCDRICGQPLTAQVSSEATRAYPDRDGRLRLHPRQRPLLEVRSVSYGPDPSYLTSLSNLASVWVERDALIVPISGWVGGFTGGLPLQFGRGTSNAEQLVAFTYVAGYACTTLAAPGNANDPTVQVKDPTGLIPGVGFQISDGKTREALTVLTVAGNMVTLVTPLTQAHMIGAGVSSLPDDAKAAAVLLTSALIRQRPEGATGFRGHSATVTGSADANELYDARLLLTDFMAVR